MPAKTGTSERTTSSRKGQTGKNPQRAPTFEGATMKGASAKRSSGKIAPEAQKGTAKLSESKTRTKMTPKPKAETSLKKSGSQSKGGEKAPDFKLTADDGSTVSLTDFAGKTVVLYFYPKDNTPGCTRQACAFQENLGRVQAEGAVVLGVSRDSPKTHTGFKSKYNLTFPLLADPDASVHKLYGAWGSKTMYGKEVIGAIRSTVIIDPSGRIAKRFPNVKVDGHAEQVISALRDLKAAS